MSSDISNEYWADLENYEEINEQYNKKMEILIEPRRTENNIYIKKYKKNSEYNKKNKKMTTENILKKYTNI